MDKQTLLAGYGLGQYLIAGNTGGVTHEESLVQPSRAGNCINWIAGHLLDARGIILGLLGGSPFLAAEETALYKRGSAISTFSPLVSFQVPCILRSSSLPSDSLACAIFESRD